jgi:poly(3-hydroxybutyrate) depolymerase
MSPLSRSIAALFAVAASTPSLAATAADFLYRNSNPDGSGMPYRVFIPPGYDASQVYPLILFLHGAGERGNNNTSQLNNNANGAMQLVSDANLAIQKVIMVAPQCPSADFWGGGSTNTPLHDILNDVSAEFRVDPDRIIVTGLSMGGYGTWGLTASNPSRFAAGVPMSGGGDVNAAGSVSALPYWFFHAVNDGTVGVDQSRALVTALRNAGASVIYTEYTTGGHGIWPVVYNNPLLFRWMMAQRRGAPSATQPPILRIEQPTAAPGYSTDLAQLVLGGSVDNGGHAITSVAWDRLGGGAASAANGTLAWTTPPIALNSGSNLLRVTATGTSWHAPYGGATTINDALRVNRIGPPPLPGALMTAVNSGGADVAAADGTTYIADIGFEGGSTQVSNVAVANTTDDALYNNWRWGNFFYRTPVYNGPYDVDLHFAETYNAGVGLRKFSVLIEGQPVLSEFDIAAAAGVNTALVRRFRVEVTDGELTLEVRNGSIGNARLDALRIYRAGDTIFRYGFEAAP